MHVKWVTVIYEHIFLNLFRTQLFREFKLCKLLLRPLDDHSSARCSSSRQLRGYSRQTESYISSLSNTVDNSANDADFDDYNLPWGDLRRSALYRYQRPGSRAYSLPTKVGLGTLQPFTYYWGGRRCIDNGAPGVAPLACQPRSDWVRRLRLVYTADFVAVTKNAAEKHVVWMAVRRRAILSTCLVLPLAAVTDRDSGNILRLHRVCEWIASGLGSIKLLKHGLQKAMLLWNM